MAGDVIPAPFVITGNDKRGLIVVTGGCTLAFVWACFFVRVWLRRQVREWRSDDYFLAAATVRQSTYGRFLHGRGTVLIIS